MYSTETITRAMTPRPSGSRELRVAPSARETLRALLRRMSVDAPLGDAAIDTIVDHSQITNWRAGQTITAAGPSDFVHFVVGGAVRLDLRTTGRPPITVAFLPPGRFIGSPLPIPVAGPPFVAVAHVPSLVAVVSHATMSRVFESLRLDRILALTAKEIGWTNALIAAKCRLGSHQIADRLTGELAVLANAFGRPVADGVLIDLPLIHEDLARLVLASRANVTRALGAMRRSGAIALVSRRIVLRQSNG